MTFFPESWQYTVFDLEINLPGDSFDIALPGVVLDRHLFGAKDGMVHIFGTDATGKDIYSRTLHAIYTSLSVGAIGVFISFFLALLIGGFSGFYGGLFDSITQMITDAIRTVPAIPLFMAIAAFIPDEWRFRDTVFRHCHDFGICLAGQLWRGACAPIS